MYRSSVTVKNEPGIRHKRLRIVNHSSGYWVVIEFGQPSFCKLPEYKETWDFWVFTAQSDNKNVNPNAINWDKNQTEWGYSRADHFWQARKLSPTDSWSAPCHSIDFRHPLLMLLRQGVETPE